jgi:hypothetical protein
MASKGGRLLIPVTRSSNGGNEGGVVGARAQTKAGCCLVTPRPKNAFELAWQKKSRWSISKRHYGLQFTATRLGIWLLLEHMPHTPRPRLDLGSRWSSPSASA